MNSADLQLSGGIGVYTHQLAEALAAYDDQNDYKIFLYEHSLPEWLNRPWPANVELVGLRRVRPGARWKSLQHLLGLPVTAPDESRAYAQQVDKAGVDLVYFPNTTIYPLSIATPCVLGFADMQHEYYPQFFTTEELEHRAQVYAASVNKAVHLIVPSDYTRRTLLEKYGTADSKISIVPYAVSDKYQPAKPEKVQAVRAKYQLPERFIFYPANPWPHKNHARLIAALRLYQARFGEPPTLVLSGRLRNEVRDPRALAVAAGVEPYVIDLGFVASEDIPGLYGAATFMIFPSLFEGLGIPMLEAMACGCPIAAANATAIPECVGEAALLFDPLDPAAICEAIHTLWTSPQLRDDLVAKGFRHVSNYHWPKLVPKIVEVYRASHVLRS